MNTNSKLMDMLTGYVAAHQHPINVTVHMIGIPTIMLGVFIPLSWVSIEIVDFRINFAQFAVIAFAVFYMTLDVIFGVVFLAVGFAIATLANLVGKVPGAGTIAALAFVGGWLAQFIGHMIEKSVPVVLKHPIQAHIAAPFFVVVELFKFAGLRDALFNEVQSRLSDVRQQRSEAV
jgi:uncharacterized membrane protein YGL010W